VDAFCRMIRQAGEHVGEPGLRIDVVELGGLCRPPNYAERFEIDPKQSRHCGPSHDRWVRSIRHSFGHSERLKEGEQAVVGTEADALAAHIRL